MLGEIVGSLEPAAGIAMKGLEPREMHRLRSARAIGRRVFWPARRGRRRLRDHDRLLVVEREPGLPVGIGNCRAVGERAAERWQALREIGIFGDERFLLACVRCGAAHLADEMHHRVATRDIDVELVERVAAEVLEILLHLHGDVGTRQIVDEFVSVGPELVGNRRKKDADRHALTLFERRRLVTCLFRPRARLPRRDAIDYSHTFARAVQRDASEAWRREPASSDNRAPSLPFEKRPASVALIAPAGGRLALRRRRETRTRNGRNRVRELASSTPTQRLVGADLGHHAVGVRLIDCRDRTHLLADLSNDVSRRQRAQGSAVRRRRRQLSEGALPRHGSRATSATWPYREPCSR
jgi:hypothetical protein